MNDESRALSPPVETAEDATESDQLELFQQIIETERERSRALDRRTDVALEAVKASDAADQRQYDFHMRRLESDERLAKAHLSLLSKTVLGVGALVTVFVLLVLYMLFFGTPTQADRAQTILTWVFVALGGGGLFVAAQRVAKFLKR